MRKWGALAVLAAAQFLMVLDQAVMNVSISQLVEDFDTDVTKIQGAITFYALVMAALMITGGKLGDRWGRRRAFAVGHIIYGLGSALTAVAWSVPVLIAGWSVLEGIGAALVLPALVALVAGSYHGRDRALAYGVIGGVAGAGIAVGPILGGWVTTNATWRYVFVGEVVLAVAIVASIGMITEAAREGPRPDIDWVGSALSAAGLGVGVWGILQASQWGWLEPRNSPIEPLGFALTPFVIGGGVLLLFVFRWWQERRERLGREPLVRFSLFDNHRLTGGLLMFLAQNIILMGVFFALPLYLQIVLGLDALDTGVRMLPISVAMFITSSLGARLTTMWSPRRIIRIGLTVLVVATLVLLGTLEPVLRGLEFTVAMALLGIGMGLLAAVLGNLVQSSVSSEERSQAGGLQYTAAQLGSAIGTAFIGAVVIGGLVTGFQDTVAGDPRISDEVRGAISISLTGDVSFLAADQVRAAAEMASLPAEETEAIVSAYESAQLRALKAGVLAAVLVALAALVATGRLPARTLMEMETEESARAP